MRYTGLMNELVQALRQELSAVEADISKLESEASKLQARLRSALDKADKLKAVIALYLSDQPEQPQPQLFIPVANQAADLAAVAEPVSKQRHGSKASLLKAEVTHLLDVRGTEHRQKILDHLVSKGLMGHEKNPLANLAAYLSDNKDVFATDGRGNFSLRRVGRHEPSPALERSAGSAEDADRPAPSPQTNRVMEGEVL